MVNVVADATGPVLVLGAAGTGKTTLLVEAVAEHARSLGLEPHLFPTADGTKAALVVSVPDAAGSTSHACRRSDASAAATCGSTSGFQNRS